LLFSTLGSFGLEREACEDELELDRVVCADVAGVPDMPAAQTTPAIQILTHCEKQVFQPDRMFG
jgi:hypothetical protein